MISVLLSPAISTVDLVRFDTVEEAEAYIAACPPEVRDWLFTAPVRDLP